VITPFPYKAAAEIIEFLCQLKVLLQITRSVAHCMGILTKYKWLMVVLIAAVLAHLSEGGVHSAFKIKV
jgi:hypothetical protein